MNITEQIEAEDKAIAAAIRNEAIATCIELVEHYFFKRSGRDEMPAPFGYSSLISDLKALKE